MSDPPHLPVKPNATVLSETLDRLTINPSVVTTPTSPVLPTTEAQAPVSRPLVSPSPSGARATAQTPSRRQTPSLDRRQTSRSPQAIRKQPPIPSATPTRLARELSSEKSTSSPSTSSTIDFNPLQDTTYHTPAAIAAEYFKKELAHHNNNRGIKSDCVVIIHDACYGHRFSRPRTSKTNLSLIVERPERVQAVVRGISSAYVRLGGRYGDGVRLQDEAPKAIPFIMRRSTRSVPITSPVVTNVHGVRWMEELKTLCTLAGDRLALGQKELARSEEIVDGKPKAHLHEGDLYLCPESLDAFQGALGGVLDAVDQVFSPSSQGQQQPARKTFVCVRPPGHHCSAGLPSGFCWLNNVHVGIEHAAQAHGLTHAAIIDFDLHHGDGSQAITWERNAKVSKLAKNVSIHKKTSIGYFSLHDINSYPCEDGDPEKVQSASLCVENAHNQTVWNVHLQPWKTEADFWDLYKTRYLVLLDKARAFLRAHTQRVRMSAGNVQPRAAIFISAGFDASEYEGEGMQRHKVNVPTEFYARFTSDIVKLAEEEGTSVDGRVISVLEGGYSDRALASGTVGHLVGLSGTTETLSKFRNHTRRSSVSGVESPYPNQWWNTLAMNELETLVNASRGQAKRSRASDVVTHASPTQSFLSKVVDPAKLWKGPAPPPPVVDWATAAFELSKLLIPNDRQVDSYRSEELTEPRMKRERPASVSVAPKETVGEKMQLRERRTREATQPIPHATLPLRPARSRKSTESMVTPRISLPPEATLEPVAGTRSREGSASDIEQLTSSVKKITLRLSDKDKRELHTSANVQQFPAAAPAKKTVAARITKTVTPRTSAARLPKTTKSGPSTPLATAATPSTQKSLAPGMAAAQALSRAAQTEAIRAPEMQEVKPVGLQSSTNGQSRANGQSNANDFTGGVANKEGKSGGTIDTIPKIELESPLNFDPAKVNGGVTQFRDGELQEKTGAPPSSQIDTTSPRGNETADAPQEDSTQTDGAPKHELSTPLASRTNTPTENITNSLPTASQYPSASVQQPRPLPVFSAHGHIPFGHTYNNNNNNNSNIQELPPSLSDSNDSHDTGKGQGNNEQRESSSIWDIPETPRK